MKKGFICFLLLSLACQYINCQSTCPGGEVFVQKCEKCTTPIKISEQYHSCVNICRQKQSATFYIKQCEHQCSNKLNPNKINCQEENCLIIDISKTPATCLKQFSECKNGKISKNGLACLQECPSYELPIYKNGYQQCGKGDKKTHKKKITKKCDTTEYSGPNNTCIPFSACSGFIGLTKNKCELKRCDYYTSFKLDKIGKPYKQCHRDCSGFQYREDDLLYCSEKCPIDRPMIYITPSDKKNCQNDCYDFQYQYEKEGKQYCTEQCPTGMITNQEFKRCLPKIN